MHPVGTYLCSDFNGSQTIVFRGGQVAELDVGRLVVDVTDDDNSTT